MDTKKSKKNIAGKTPEELSKNNELDKIIEKSKLADKVLKKLIEEISKGNK